MRGQRTARERSEYSMTVLSTRPARVAKHLKILIWHSGLKMFINTKLSLCGSKIKKIFIYGVFYRSKLKNIVINDNSSTDTGTKSQYEIDQNISFCIKQHMKIIM